MIRKHLAAEIAVFVVVVAAVALYTFTASKKYESTAQLLAMSGQGVVDPNSGNASQFTSAASYINTQIATYPQLVKTETVLAPVIRQLGLDQTVEETAEMITATNPTGTFMVNITAVTGSPDLSQELVNAVAESLSDQVSTSMDTMDKDKAPVTLSVVQQAQLPEGPSSPKVALYFAAGVVLGAILGIGFAVVKELLNTKVDSSSDVRTITGSSTIGTIPMDDLLDSSQPVVISQTGSAVAEEYRKIRTNLAFLNTDREGDKGQLVVITSATPSEGKTTTSVNTAVALAEDGKKVLLIDADLRHPSVAHKLGMEGSAGLAHVLSGQMSPKDVVQSYWKPTLHILPAGKRPANASILLNSATMTMLVEQALTQYDYVVIDTTPMSVSNDGVVFGKLAGGIVMVVGKGVCEKKDLQETTETFKTAKVPLLGFILNFADPKKHHNSNYYYYDDGAPRSNQKKRKTSHSRRAK